MKLKDLLEAKYSLATAQKWLHVHNANLDIDGRESDWADLANMLGERDDNPAGFICLTLDYKHKQIDACPIAAGKWDDTFSIDSIFLLNGIFDDPKNLPRNEENGNAYDFRNCTIKTLKFPANLDVLELHFADNCKFECGLLSLLKISSLRDFTIYDLDGDPDKIDAKLAKAFEIVTEHFHGDKDVIACQTELIDADLDEYAKL